MASFYAVTFLTLTAVAARPDEPQHYPDCVNIQLSGEIIQVNSAAWNENESSLLLSDPMMCKIVEVSIFGKIHEWQVEFDEELTGLRSSRYPSQPCPARIRNYGELFIAEFSSDQAFNFVDNKSRSLGDLFVTPRKMMEPQNLAEGQSVLAAVIDWTAMSRGLLAFGDVYVDQGDTATARWHSAIVYVPIDPAASIVEVMPARLSDLARSYFLINWSLLTSLRGDGYALVMEERPRIMEFDSDSQTTRELQHFPTEFDRVPYLPPGRSMREAITHYRIIEKSSMPIGLYSDGEFLFLLARRATKTGPNLPTDWILIRTDAHTGEEIERVVLLSQSAHLLVVPGPKYWAFIEIGPVEVVGEIQAPYMHVGSIRFMKSEAISAMSEGRFVCPVIRPRDNAR